MPRRLRAVIRRTVHLLAAPRKTGSATASNAPQRAAPSACDYSTDKPSTFCQPLGNSPPRVARAPTYASRSLNDSVIVRLPDFTDSVAPGATTATATTRSVPSLAFDV